MSEQLSREEQVEQKRSYWKRHIENWRSSQLTQAAYCQQHDLKAHRFTYWKKRFVETESGITFVPIKLQSPLNAFSGMGTPSLRLIVDREFQIEVGPDFDPGHLKKLIVAIRLLP